MTLTTCPNVGDMDECKKKPRCAWGECEGQSLPGDPDDYCPSGYSFREEFCDCTAEGCYDEPTVLEVTYTALLYQPDKFSCGQVNCNVNCEDRGVMRECGFLTSTFQININAGECLKVEEVTTSDPRFTDICEERPAGWPELNRYVKFLSCPPSAEIGTLDCFIASHTINPPGCFVGFTYTFSVEVVEGA